MPNYITIPVESSPGIQRDGTKFNSKSYVDGQWCRFYMGKPRKIGGYKIIDNGNGTIIRTLYNVPKPNAVDTYIGRSDSLNYVNFDLNGVGGAEIDRTPVGYVSNPNNSWTFDLFTNRTNPEDSLIVSQVCPNATDVSNTTEGPIYYGDTVGATMNDRLVQILDDSSNPILVSGGVVYSSPIMIAYGNNGLIRWSDPGQIQNWPLENNQVITNTKIIKMIRARGSAFPQILAWTLNSLINVTYQATGEDVIFSSVVVQENITVMSPNSIVGYDQQFFWIGIDQFYFFNGIVQRLENSMSTDWFFNNVNLSQRAKIWGMSIPRFKEIWWFYPRGNSTECNAVIIYNVELAVWYDSFISRSAGASPGIFPLPMMSDNSPLGIVTRSGRIFVYPLWMHEYRYDMAISNDNISSINSYFETRLITLFESNPSMNRLVRVRRIENDFVQTGNLTVTVNNRMFPSDTVLNGNLIQTGPYEFDINTQKVDSINSQGRIISLFFQSNEMNGSYQMGKTLLDYDIGDVNP